MLIAYVANSMAEEWTDLLSHTLTMRGGHVASLVKFSPVIWEEVALQTDDGMLDALTDSTRKIMLLVHTVTMRGSVGGKFI